MRYLALLLTVLLIGCQADEPQTTTVARDSNGNDIVNFVPPDTSNATLVSDEILDNGMRMTVHETENGDRIGTYHPVLVED